MRLRFTETQVVHNLQCNNSQQSPIKFTLKYCSWATHRTGWNLTMTLPGSYHFSHFMHLYVKQILKDSNLLFLHQLLQPYCIIVPCAIKGKAKR